jgi:hypothetical protein
MKENLAAVGRAVMEAAEQLSHAARAKLSGPRDR